MRSFHRTIFAAALALVLGTACKKEAAVPAPEAPAPPAPAAIASIRVGNAIGADEVFVASDTLGARDTIYVAINTTGVGTGVKIKALWTMGAETVQADSLTVDLGGPATTSFHIMRGGTRRWPAGAYTVAVSLNDGAPMTHNFVVR